MTSAWLFRLPQLIVGLLSMLITTMTLRYYHRGLIMDDHHLRDAASRSRVVGISGETFFEYPFVLTEVT